MKPPEPFVWHQRDAMELECTSCGKIVRAECLDLHQCN